jgi:hypothetical protein
MVARFEERGEWCWHLENSGSRVNDLILGLADGQVPLVAHLEQAVVQFWVIQDEHQALWSLASWVWDLVVEGSREASSLEVALSSIVHFIEGRFDAVAANRALWEGGGSTDCCLVTLP